MTEVPGAKLAHVLKVLALLVAGGLAVGGGAAALKLTDDKVALGDRVTYHVYAFRASDNVLVYTTDLERARAEVSGGNTGLPLLQEQDYDAPTRDVVLTNGTFDPIRFILGYRVGDVVATPAIHHPFGASADLPTTTFPRTLGPVPIEFTIELEEVYAEGSPSWFKQEVPREALVPGTRVPYVGGSEVDVLDVVEGTARLRLVVDERTPEVIRSRGLDIPLRIEPIATDAILVHVELDPGTSFETSGCSKHGIVLQKGAYTVEEVTDEAITVRAVADPGLAPVLDQDLRFEFRVTALEKWPHAGLSSGVAALTGLWHASHSSEDQKE